MALDNLTPSEGSTHRVKRIGRGQGSGMGKTATRGGKGQTARTGSSRKRGFEGGQNPLQRRLPKIGFTSRIEKPYTINVEKIKAIASLSEITLETISSVHKMAKSVTRVKLIGASAKSLVPKIKDEAVTASGSNG